MFYRHKKTGIIYNRTSFSHWHGVIIHTFTPLKNKGYDTKDKIEGLSKIKGIGEKAAKIIEAERKENGKYKDYDDVLDRMEQYGRIVNKRVLEILYTEGAIDFNKTRYFSRCEKYNSALYGRANNS